MLTLYRRHTKQCPFSSVRQWRCGCPVWAQARSALLPYGGVPNLVSKEAGQRIIDRRENQGFVDNDLSFPCSPKEETALNPSELTTIDEAIQDFLLGMEYRHLGGIHDSDLPAFVQ